MLRDKDKKDSNPQRWLIKIKLAQITIFMLTSKTKMATKGHTIRITKN